MLLTDALTLFKAAVLDTVWSVLYFPIWWYGPGLWRATRGAFGLVGQAARDFDVRIWLKNLLRPMFGQRDITGRIISFVLRVVVMSAYSVALVVLALFAAFLVLVWLSLPPLVAYGFFRQFFLLLSQAA